MKKHLFMALVAATLLSNVATASQAPQSYQAEKAATAIDAAEQGTVLPCGKLVSSVRRDSDKLIEPTQVAAATHSKGAPAKAGKGME